MGQVVVFGEHTVSHLETAGILDAVCALKAIDVAFVTNHLEWVCGIDMVLTILVGT